MSSSAKLDPAFQGAGQRVYPYYDIGRRNEVLDIVCLFVSFFIVLDSREENIVEVYFSYSCIYVCIFLVIFLIVEYSAFPLLDVKLNIL